MQGVSSTQGPAGSQDGEPWFSFRSLRGKLQLFALLLIAVPGGLMALIGYLGARQAIERTAALHLTDVAHDALNEVMESVNDARRDLRTWARQEVMQDLAIGDLDKRLARMVRSLVEAGEPFVALRCVDLHGQVIATSDPHWLPWWSGDRAVVEAALAGKEHRGTPQALPDDGRMVIELAVPILAADESGAPLGALVGYFDWRHALARVQRIRQTLLAHGLLLHLAILDAPGAIIGESWTDVLGPDREQIRAAVVRALGRGQAPRRRGTQVLRSAGVLVAWERARSAMPGWVGVAIEPLSEAYGPVVAMGRRSAVALALVLAAGLTLATLWARRMTAPLRALTNATQAIAATVGTPTPVAVQSRDEIGSLATAFNAMVRALTRAQEDLVAAARFALIGELAAGIAHEVRTPLGILRGSAQMLARTVPPENPQCGELAGMIVDEVDRLERVVTGLLELARPRPPALEPTPLAAVLARAVDFLGRQARERRVELHAELDPQLPPVECDGEQIYQVALNIILNALQVVPTGGHVTVRTCGVARGRLGFEVIDDGPGIASELRERIFAPFVSTRPGGTGLGLAVVDRIVRAHGGVVQVESEVGRGTTFRVELPVSGGTA